jgi:tetratricopeptide (TPR) repeat protein
VLGAWRLLVPLGDPAPAPGGPVVDPIPSGLVAVLPVEGPGELLDDGVRVALTFDLADELGTAGVPILALDTNRFWINLDGRAARVAHEPDPSAAAFALPGVTEVVRTALARPAAGIQLDVSIERAGRPPWRQRFARPETEATLLVDEIARAIATELGHKDPRRPRDAGTYAAGVYAAYGDALVALLADECPECGRRRHATRRPLEAVVAANPRLLRAAARLAADLVANAQVGEEAGWAMRHVDLANQLLDKVLEVDPDHPLALANRGVAAAIAYDWPRANAALKRAYEVAPTDSLVGRHYNYMLVMQGQFDEATPIRERVFAANPGGGSVVGEAFNLHYRRRYADVVALRDRIERLPPAQRSLGLTYVALSLAELAQFDDAVAVADQLDKHPDRAVVVVYAAAGKRDKAIALREQIGDAAGFFSRARMDAALGDDDAALRALEIGVERHVAEALFLKIEHYPPRLRAHPRFQALMKKVGLD